MAADATNVSTGKPKVGGAIWRAPLGSVLPTDATSALDAAFVNLGYVDEAGVTNSNSPESDNVKAWGGDNVASIQTAKPDSFKYKLIESLNADVLKAVYGTDNVTEDLNGEIKITANASDQEEACWVIEMIMKGSKVRRIVIPDGKISEVGDIVYKDDECIGYDLTVLAVPDTDGNTHYEYIK